MDFRADAHASALFWLQRFGHKKADGLERPYLNFLYLRRFIPLPRPRRVLESREIRRQVKDLKPEELIGYQQLKHEVETGQRLLPRLTSHITRMWNSDFQSDWGLFHFHLGTELEPSGFVNRSDHLAIAWITKDEFYVVALVSHRPGTSPWTDTALLSVVRRNWPEILEPFRVGIGPVFPNFEGDDRATVRAAGLLALTEIDGQAYLPPGGGPTSARTSSDAVMLYNGHMHEIGDIQRGWTLHPRADRNAKLHLLPFEGCVIETRDGTLHVPQDRGNNFIRLESHLAHVYRFILDLPDPFRAPRILPT